MEITRPVFSQKQVIAGKGLHLGRLGESAIESVQSLRLRNI
jgi:hypothetical protein